MRTYRRQMKSTVTFVADRNLSYEGNEWGVDFSTTEA